MRGLERRLAKPRENILTAYTHVRIPQRAGGELAHIAVHDGPRV